MRQKKQSIREEIYKEIEQYLLEVEDEPEESDEKSIDDNKYLGFKFRTHDMLPSIKDGRINIVEGEEEERFLIPLKSALNHKWDLIFKKINGIFENYSKVEIDKKKEIPGRFF